MMQTWVAKNTMRKVWQWCKEKVAKRSVQNVELFRWFQLEVLSRGLPETRGTGRVRDRERERDSLDKGFEEAEACILRGLVGCQRADKTQTAWGCFLNPKRSALTCQQCNWGALELEAPLSRGISEGLHYRHLVGLSSVVSNQKRTGMVTLGQV